MPPAPVGRAYTSPLVDMFNNPAMAPKVSPERPTNPAGESHFIANHVRAKGALQNSTLSLGFRYYYQDLNSRIRGGA